MGDLPPLNVSSLSVVSSHRISAVKNLDESDGNFTSKPSNYHPWGVFFTVLGTVLLDFDADACQSPARAYLLDVIVEGQLNAICNGLELKFLFKMITQEV